MKCNGKIIHLGHSMPLKEALAHCGFNSADHIALERNGQIVLRKDFEQTVINEDDVLEIVHFVGGG